MQEEEKKKALAWVGVIAILLVLIVAVRWPHGNNPQSQGPAPVYAPKGELTPQFPKELILGGASAVGNSYAINYSSSTNQYTAQWSSASSLANIVAQYKTYLSANGWSVTVNKSVTPSFQSIFARKANLQTLVSIVTEATGTQVTVTYVKN